MVADVIEQSVPTHDLGAERAVLGAVLLSNKTLKQILGDIGLRPDHFYRETHQQAFTAIVEMADEGVGIDALTLAHRIGVPATKVDELYGSVPMVGHYREYASRVVEMATWRRRQTAAYTLLAAAQTQDAELLANAEELLAAPPEQEKRTHTVEQVRAAAAERARVRTPKPKGVPFPFDKLNKAGGMRPGQLTVVGARQKQGKSVFVDQCLDQAGKHGIPNPHLYLLEMSEEERVERFQARLGLVDYSRIIDDVLGAEERDRIAKASERIPCGMTEAAGWTPAEIIRHARWHRFPFIAVDHMHRFALREEADVADCVRRFRDFAAQTGTHVILAAQLNEKRVTGQQRPRPALTDLRGSGQIAAEAHYVTFVYRPDDEKGREGEQGEIWHAACRSGKPYVGERVVLNGGFMRFEIDDAANEDWRNEL